ncbi:MAG: hypothetical protein AAFO29_14495 [Actinomycetota bacterium]
MTDTTPAPLADPELGPIDDLVRLDRYPIDRPDQEPGSHLVSEVRAQLADGGCATLPGFLDGPALHTLAQEIEHLAAHVPILQHTASVYARTELERRLPADDPRRVRLTWHAGHVTRDMLPPFSVAQRLYVSPWFKAFVAAVVGQARIFEYADPLAGLVATVLPPGGRYPWHYDTNEYVVTIMVTRPESGGRFEFHPDLRRPGHENLDGLGAVLAGRPASPPRIVDPAPGDLQLFLGRYSLHQVTGVAGSTPRHVLVLSYAKRPGVIGPVDRTRSVYGRITEAHLLAEEVGPADQPADDGLIR